MFRGESATDTRVKEFLTQIKMLFDSFANAFPEIDPAVPDGIEGKIIVRPKLTPELCIEMSKHAQKLIEDIDCDNY